MISAKGIDQAKLDWDASENGLAPRSIFFDDIYFSGDGPAEAAHVFLDGNNLARRFATAERLAIGELGFGTGLNFLSTVALWRKKAPSNARLTLLSIEAFPLHREDMERAHAAWPELASISADLRAASPPAVAGLHRIAFADDITLLLYYGDAGAALDQLEAKVDAWFLDGFAPAKNPAMWSPDLMKAVARLSAPGASFSTFTVAGDVRRGLINAGFDIEKRPGFGRKREMLTGTLTAAPARRSNRKPWFQSDARTLLASGARVAIIGAGIAGASLAYECRRAGLAPVLFDHQGPAAGASGNPAGLIMPRLDAEWSPAARFHVSAYLHTLRLLNEFNEAASTSLFNACGARWLPRNDTDKDKLEKLETLRPLPADWMRCEEGALFFPQAGVVDPQTFVSQLISEDPVKLERIEQISQTDKGWRLIGDNTSETYDAVIVANGLDALRFAQLRSMPLRGFGGQIDIFENANAPDSAVASGTYAAPAPQNGAVIGATYEHASLGDNIEPSSDATRSNIESIKRFLPEIAAGLDTGAAQSRASMRCATPDGVPVVGPVPDWGFYASAYDGLRQGRVKDYPTGRMLPGLYVLSGLGSRGLVTAPLAAAVIVAELTGAPSPVDHEVSQRLHPARFFIRALKRKSAQKS